MKPFSFIHVADIHLGYEQYNLSERREDFDKAFTEVINKALELKPDFMIIAGDLFHHPRPLNVTLEGAIRNFKRLKDANIPVLVVDGSHDTAPNLVTGTILNPLDSAGLIYYLPRHENASWENECCYIYGVPNFRTRERVEKQLPAFYDLKKPIPRKDKFNIFVFHMALDLPEVSKVYSKTAVEAPLELMPEGFNYYAGGHIHMPLHLRFKEGVLAYSGSTENVSYEDACFEKGFYYVEVDEDYNIRMNHVKIEGIRKFKVIDKEYNGLSPHEITERAVKAVEEADEDGAIIVPVLRGVLPAGSTRGEIELARIRKAASKALIVHPILLLRESDFPEKIIRSIFESEMKDLRSKSYEYFLQFFSQRYSRGEAEKKAQAALNLMQYLIKEDEDGVKRILEALFE